MPVILTEIMPSLSVNITYVSSCTKTLGELLTVQKDTQKSGVTVHLKTLIMVNPAQVNGLVMILNGLLLPIWNIMILMVMDKSVMMITWIGTIWTT